MSIRKISLSLVFLWLIGMQVVFAQSRDISGVVISGDDGNTIPGASVVVKGTTIGTITDMEGKFSLKAPQNAKAGEDSVRRVRVVSRGRGKDCESGG